jgi:hypothetical protein
MRVFVAVTLAVLISTPTHVAAAGSTAMMLRDAVSFHGERLIKSLIDKEVGANDEVTSRPSTKP